MLRVAEHYATTDTGLLRSANEDSLLSRSPLFVVADGMGGAQAGEVASRLAVEAFGEAAEDFSDPTSVLTAHAHIANTRIYELAHDDASYAGMGTTVTAIYVGEQEVTVAHVGDSRAYCLRDGELQRLTDDHSLVDELIRQGRLTPEEAEDHPQRSIITRALGPEASVEVDTRSFKARAGDLYMLCSDGLTSMLGERRLEAILLDHAKLSEAGEALIEAANAAGGRDNITVVLLRLEEVHGFDGAHDGEHTTAVDLQPVPAATDGHAHAHLATPELEGSVQRRMPRQGAGAQPAGKRRRLRKVFAPATVLVVLGLLAAGAYLTFQSLYFIGTDNDGLVTIYNGVPYQLPGGINLYTTEYVSGVSASTLTPARRHSLLDHSLRSEANAGELVRELELGQIEGG
ncbi:MAG TPA: Stp1/IreP family PP2C-type Ser/Thr phosphatase [Solirubrobacteraceae bacterium]|jgi:protein phosphatase